jgi:hypothetical protein
MRTNPVRNAYEYVSTKKLVTCKRCGTKDLAWVKFKSGKWALVHTGSERPFYSGQNQTPQAAPGMVYALKTSYHNCGQEALQAARYAVDADLARGLADAVTVKADMPLPELQNMVATMAQHARIKDAAKCAVDYFFAEVLYRQ